jgi:hypothetical protein
MKKLSTLMIFLISTSVFGQKQQNQKTIILQLQQMKLTELTKLIETANVQGLSLGILNNKKSFIQKHMVIRIKRKMNYWTLQPFYMQHLSVNQYLPFDIKLVQDKILDLDKPIYEYLSKPLPLYEDYAELANDNRINYNKNVLSHTTGLPNTRWINVRTGEIDTVGPMKIYFKPGTRYAYSGEGLKLLQW